MKKKLFIVFLVLNFLNNNVLEATVLRNGVDVPQEKIDKVWEALHEIDKWPYFFLVQYCFYTNDPDLSPQEAENQKKEEYKRFKQETINTFEKLGLMHEGMVDKETENIIISSYYGSCDGKIVRKRYPVISFIEKLPGYGLYISIKYFFKILLLQTTFEEYYQ
ncbi:MAG: hypothetical protein AB7R69_00435 [Candidatus Babeliales bacterium]